jgi:hypothetical protein
MKPPRLQGRLPQTARLQAFLQIRPLVRLRPQLPLQVLRELQPPVQECVQPQLRKPSQEQLLQQLQEQLPEQERELRPRE